MSVDVEEVRQRVETLRRELPPGAPIVPVATVRARDRAEVITGVRLDLGLASSLLGDPQLGDWVHLRDARLQCRRGILGEADLEERVDGSDVLVVDEIDELGLARIIQRVSPPRVVLTPTRIGHLGIDGINTMLGIRGGGVASGVELIATLTESVLLAPRPETTGPVGLLFLGGDDLPHARLRARCAREVLNQR